MNRLTFALAQIFGLNTAPRADDVGRGHGGGHGGGGHRPSHRRGRRGGGSSSVVLQPYAVEEEDYIDLEPEDEHVLTMSLDGHASPETVEAGLRRMGFQNVAVLNHGTHISGAGRTARGPHTVTFAARVRAPTRLHNTPRGTWSQVWPVKVSALDPVQFTPRVFRFIDGVAYDLRLLSSAKTPAELAQSLTLSGFALHNDPVLLQPFVHHPAMRGTLSDWIVQATWVKPDTTLLGGTGAVLFEDVVPIT